MVSGRVAGLLDGMSGGFGFPFGCGAAVVAVLLAALAGPSPWYALVTLGLVVLLTALWSTAAAALGVAVVAWALDSGFVLGRAGELTFSAAAAVAALVFAALLASGFAARLASRPASPRIPAPRTPVPTPQSRVSAPQSREIALQSRESRLQSRESRLQSRESRA